MHQQWRNIEKSHRETPFHRMEKLHPHKMLLILGAMGSGLISMFLLAGYLVMRYQAEEALVLPRGFIVGTVALMFSSFLVYRVSPLFSQDRIRPMLTAMGIAVIMGLTFGFCQYFAWHELMAQGVEFDQESAGAYLYFLSGAHLVQFIAGLAYLSYLLFEMWKTSLDPVKSLIMNTNPYQRIKLDILAWSWYFLSFGWLAIFLVFVFTI